MYAGGSLLDERPQATGETAVPGERAIPGEPGAPGAPGAPVESRIPGPLLLGLGGMCVALGFVGVFVPGLPTTIFLLIAAWCFVRSNPRAHAWLLRHRILGPYVRDVLSGQGMPVRSKVIAIAIMWIACGTSAWFFVSIVWVKVVIMACAVAGTVAVLRVPSRAVEPADRAE
jgi:uncharacterized membrane protein YbaN (DUF454 family)